MSRVWATAHEAAWSLETWRIVAFAEFGVLVLLVVVVVIASSRRGR